MPKQKFALVALAIAAAALTLGAGAVGAVLPGGGIPNAPANLALFVASQPSSSTKVGIFVARRQNGEATLYYCSSPVDANSKDPSGCKQINGFPAK